MEAAIILGALVVLLGLRVPVAFALGGLGVILLWWKGFPLVGVPQRLYGTMDSFELLAVPMFLLMSGVLLKGGVGKDLFAAVQSWVGHWPGGLGVATIISCALFSAISGSSVATAATIGTVALPEMEARGYNRSFTLGMLAAGGTLGILIPPSIPLILYGVVTEESIPSLFLAGIGPGLFLAGLFIIYGMLYSRFGGGYTPSPKADWAERKRATLMALPTILLAACIIGSIYAGIATPSESAGVGFVLALAMTYAMGRMDWEKVKDATHKAMVTTIMIFLIIAGAKVFSYAITLFQIPQAISTALTTNISDANIFMLAVGGVLLLMGFFLESISMLLIMVPVLYPALEAMGIHPIWFGIFFVVLIETALITPPVGMNLFIIQAVGKAKLQEVVRGAWPFAIMMLATAALLWFWQDLALYLVFKF
ncbi:TRAP transporter large permease [Cohaesibacter gelatinilyticus]|uniref:TRAP transporter large permease protein n=1 Tax=Cohaesibacter gelatinilyticus TaxID=372072 RepID=A0A285PH03_9HYPH|nr:TRAP transporter large permease subunit [Cohaesibacter gelatinilyticus]SNZ20553.1 TRAP transporter, DctM subunit [Cohaesibacter gelatinilyticus]HAT88085.1 C4-dicarboxylate ABC transporter permease [Hyphomicrobiales bacterium]